MPRPAKPARGAAHRKHGEAMFADAGDRHRCRTDRVGGPSAVLSTLAAPGWRGAGADEQPTQSTVDPVPQSNGRFDHLFHHDAIIGFFGLRQFIVGNQAWVALGKVVACLTESPAVGNPLRGPYIMHVSRQLLHQRGLSVRQCDPRGIDGFRAVGRHGIRAHRIVRATRKPRVPRV